MDRNFNDSHLMGQIGGIIAMLSALVQTLPPATRKRLVRQTHAEFESLVAAMSQSAGAPDAQKSREGAEWIRDLFLKRIASADIRTKSRKVAMPPGDSQSTASEREPGNLERPSATGVDIEL